MLGVSGAGSVGESTRSYSVDSSGSRADDEKLMSEYLEEEEEARRAYRSASEAGASSSVTDVITGVIDGLSNAIDQLKGLLSTEEADNEEKPEGVPDSAKKAKEEDFAKFGLNAEDFEGKDVYITEGEDGSTLIQVFNENGQIEEGYCYNGSEVTKVEFDEEGNPAKVTQYDGFMEGLTLDMCMQTEADQPMTRDAWDKIVETYNQKKK